MRTNNIIFCNIFFITDFQLDIFKQLHYHIGVHGLLLLLFIGFNTHYLVGIATVLILHGVIDLAKVYYSTSKNSRKLFFLDQFAHSVVIVCVAAFYVDFTPYIKQLSYTKFLLLLCAILLVTQVASVFMKVIISKWEPVKTKETDNSLVNAGQYIGMLERILIFVFISTNHFTAVGFLIAAKSIFRFGDLTQARDRKLTEYVMIGTLLSFGIAILVGIGFLKLQLYLKMN